jgi:Sarcosine oxidase A3 domain
VSVGEVHLAARLGAQGPSQVKAFTRCGLGFCQGWICSPVVAAIIAEVRGRPIAEIGTGRRRAPFQPITLGAPADLETADVAADAGA